MGPDAYDLMTGVCPNGEDRYGRKDLIVVCPKAEERGGIAETT